MRAGGAAVRRRSATAGPLAERCSRGRLIGDGAIDNAAAWIDTQARPCGIVLDLREDGGLAFDDLLARQSALLSNGEEEALPPSIIAPLPLPAIAACAARAPNASVVQMLIRLRGRHFQPALFADPGWDMLLDLIAADYERRRVAVSSPRIAAMVPPTTALRWIAAIADQSLFTRRPDPDDGRPGFIALTDLARAAMERHLAAARQALTTV